MILIADSGSTKTNWCLLSPGNEVQFFDSEGYNPYFANPDYISVSLGKALPHELKPEEVKNIFFYGAGCFEDKSHIIRQALGTLFPFANSTVGLDMLGSAKAVLGDEAGFVAILGTGTNSCIYDGQKIIANIDSLGYLLGDEGSGYYIGRMLLGDYIREIMPVQVRDEFFSTYQLSREAIMEEIYAQKFPNRFCAGFTKFIQETDTGREYSMNLVRKAFHDFFDNLVTRYENFRDYSFNCTGSIGYSFRYLLSEISIEYGMTPGKIIKTPIEGLVDYHRRKQTAL